MECQKKAKALTDKMVLSLWDIMGIEGSYGCSLQSRVDVYRREFLSYAVKFSVGRIVSFLLFFVWLYINKLPYHVST